jgi:hypothetical protein
MAIVVNTEQPSALLQKIYKAIDDRRITTWSYDSDRDFTHTAEQWKDKAYLRPKVDTENNLLKFGILTRKGQTITPEVYAIYHGRFIEMLLAHFDACFESTTASAKATSPDIVS